jgi:hypothetical protein
MLGFGGRVADISGIAGSVLPSRLAFTKPSQQCRDFTNVYSITCPKVPYSLTISQKTGLLRQPTNFTPAGTFFASD